MIFTVIEMINIMYILSYSYLSSNLDQSRESEYLLPNFSKTNKNIDIIN